MRRFSLQGIKHLLTEHGAPTFTVSVGHVHHIVLSSVEKREPSLPVQYGRQGVSWRVNNSSQRTDAVDQQVNNPPTDE